MISGSGRLVGHGAPGKFRLGRQDVDQHTLQDVGVVERLKARFQGADAVELLSCRVAQGEAGRAFVRALACALNLPVFASSRYVGPAHLGGTYFLDFGHDPASGVDVPGRWARPVPGLNMLLATFDVRGKALVFDNPTISPSSPSGTPVAGSSGAVGETHLYSDVITIDGQAIDAVVEVTDLAASTSIDDFDEEVNANQYAVAEYLQPNITTPAGTGSVTYKITFGLSGFYTTSIDPAQVVTLENVIINTYDIDGTGGGGSQYVQFTDISSYYLRPDSYLVVYPTDATPPNDDDVDTDAIIPANATRFRPPNTTFGNQTDAPGTEEGDKYRVQVTYDAISEIEIEMGQTSGAGGQAWFVFDFDQTNFPWLDGISVSSETVFEGTDSFSIQTVTGLAGETVETLSFADETALNGSDYSTTTDIEYSVDGGIAWIPYTVGDTFLIPGSGDFLVRTDIVDDGVDDDSEIFSLEVGTSNGQTGAGYVTIRDPAFITVSDQSVTEGFDDFSVQTVTGRSGDTVDALFFSDGAATATSDFATTTPIEYSMDGGSSWLAYTTGDSFTIPASGAFLVRTNIVDDGAGDNGETFTLSAETTRAASGSGTVTIAELTLSDTVVNEASTYAVTELRASPGTSLSGLTFVPGTASVTAPDIHYWDEVGEAWVSYDPSNPPSIGPSGLVYVRTTLTEEWDDEVDTGEDYGLSLGGASGTVTIMDDGTGVIFPGTLTGGSIDTDSTGLDDDTTSGSPSADGSDMLARMLDCSWEFTTSPTGNRHELNASHAYLDLHMRLVELGTGDVEIILY